MEIKDTELGQLPTDWLIEVLENVADTKSGGTPSRENNKFYNGDIPWIKSGELKDSAIEFSEENITQEGLENSSAKLFPAGTMLIALYGATVGKTGILSIDASTNQAVCGVFPNELIVPRFLMYQFIARRDELLRERYGGAQPNISQQIIRSFKIIIPPLMEQRCIVAVLKSIQDEIAAQEDIIHELHEFKYSAMAHLLKAGINGSSIPKITEVGEVPSHWNVVKFGTVMDMAQYGLSVKAGAIGRYPMLRMNNLGYGRLDISVLKYADLSDRIFSNFKLNSGDILFNRTNSYELVGKTALFDIEGEYTFASYIVRVVVQRQHLSPLFINHYLNFPGTQYRLKMLASRGASQSNISATKLKNFEIVLPPLEEQDQIAQLLDSIDEKIAAEEDRKSALEELFRTMLHQLMTGQIRLLSDEGLPL